MDGSTTSAEDRTYHHGQHYRNCRMALFVRMFYIGLLNIFISHDFCKFRMSKKAALIGSHFPTIYLTVISLLQGIALSQLVPNIITYMEIVDNPLSNIYILPLSLMLLIIFIVWHHYAIGIFFLRWFPNIIDTIIPFMISIGQFVLMSYLTIETVDTDIQLSAWTKGFAAFLVMGSFAYFAAAIRLEAELFEDLMSKASTIEHVERSRKYYIIAGFSILFQGLFAFLIVLVEMESLLIISLILILGHLVYFEHVMLHSIKPHFIKALDEFELKQSQRK